MRFLLLLLLLLPNVAVNVADACNSCGSFGRGCSFRTYSYRPVQRVYKQPVVQQQKAVASDVFVINNVNPNFPLAKQGSSFYGYSSAVSQYSVDPATILRQAFELTSSAQALAQTGLTGYKNIATAQLGLQATITERLAKGIAAEKVLKAADLDTESAVVQSTAFKLHFENGEWKVDELSVDSAKDQALAAADNGRPTPAPASGSVIAAKCVKCHGANLASPKAGLFIDTALPINHDLFGRAMEQVARNKMPPNTPLTNEEKTRIMEEMLTMIKDG